MSTSWLEPIARIGYFSRGVVYIIIGIMAILAAVGASQPEDSEGALRVLLGMPFGSLLLWLVAGGLAAHGIWRLAQSVLDADDHGHTFKSFFIRTGLFVSAVSHGLLAVFAAKTALGSGSGGGDWTAKLLAEPYGVWLVAFVGACIVGAGITISYKGFTAGFDKWMELEGRWLRLLRPVCRFGLTTRGFIMILTGSFVLLAVWRSNSDSGNKGLGDSLQWLQQQPFGPWLLGLVALGLLAFACYSITEAFNRDIRGLDEW